MYLGMCVCAGVNYGLTEIKTRSASRMAESMSVEKNKFVPRHDSTTSLSPGWKKWENKTWRVCQRKCATHKRLRNASNSSSQWLDTFFSPASHDDVIPCGCCWRTEVATLGNLEPIYISIPRWSNVVPKTMTGTVAWLRPLPPPTVAKFN